MFRDIKEMIKKKFYLMVLLLLAMLYCLPASAAEPKNETAPQEGALFVDSATGIQMAFVKGGCFQMGSVSGDGYDDEKPVHEVCVNDLYMGRHEVTQGQWQKVMGSNPSNFRNCGSDCPVEKVSWNDVQEFLRKLNSQTGKKYRLPTEAEWEYATRSGGKDEKYAGTGNENTLVDYAWYKSNSEKKTNPVGRKKPNGLGLYDMSGNVWEWCDDWHGENYYANSPKDNPQGPAAGSARVLRGGCWGNDPNGTRTTNRYRNNPGKRYSFIGFRLTMPGR